MISAKNRIEELEKQCERLRLDYLCATKRSDEAEVGGMDRRVIELLKIIQKLYNEEGTDYGTCYVYDRIVGEMEKAGYDMTTLKM